MAGCDCMDERLQFVAKLLDGEIMAVVCREFGISSKTGYKGEFMLGKKYWYPLTITDYHSHYMLTCGV